MPPGWQDIGSRSDTLRELALCRYPAIPATWRDASQARLRLRAWYAAGMETSAVAQTSFANSLCTDILPSRRHADTLSAPHEPSSHDGGSVLLEAVDLRGAGRQRAGGGDEGHRRRVDGQLGNALRGDPFAGGYRQRGAAAVRAAPRRAPRGRRASVRAWARALLLELHRGVTDLRAGRRRLALSGVRPRAQSGADPRSARQLCRARAGSGVRGRLVAGRAAADARVKGRERLFRGVSQQQGPAVVHGAVRGLGRADRHRAPSPELRRRRAWAFKSPMAPHRWRSAVSSRRRRARCR